MGTVGIQNNLGMEKQAIYPYTGFCLYEKMPSRLRCTQRHFSSWDKLKQSWSGFIIAAVFNFTLPTPPTNLIKLVIFKSYFVCHG